MESTLEDPRTCYFSFLSASKLARSGPISDKVVGNLIFETFKSLCNVQIVFKIVFRICSEYVQNVQNVFIFCQIVFKLLPYCLAVHHWKYFSVLFDSTPYQKPRMQTFRRHLGLPVGSLDDVWKLLNIPRFFLVFTWFLSTPSKFASRWQLELRQAAFQQFSRRW